MEANQNMEQKQKMEQLDAIAMHITDIYMSNPKNMDYSVDYYTQLYFENYEKIKVEVYKRHGFSVPTPKLNSFIDDAEDTLASRFK